MKRLFLGAVAVIIALSFIGCKKDEGPKTDTPQLVAHGGGAVYGYRITNSREAITNAYDNGFRYIELDFELTTDGEIVIIHDWETMAERLLFDEGPVSLEEFNSAEKFMDFTLMDLNGLLSWLHEHEGCRIITDTKNDNIKVLKKLAEGAPDDLARFIPQIYGFEEYDAVIKLGFSDIILTTYEMGGEDIGELLEFAEGHELWAITMPQAHLTQGVVTELYRAGLRVYAHTVNDLAFYEMWKENGLFGIYTDYFYPNKWFENIEAEKAEQEQK